jgi:hypothetical protein
MMDLMYTNLLLSIETTLAIQGINCHYERDYLLGMNPMSLKINLDVSNLTYIQIILSVRNTKFKTSSVVFLVTDPEVRVRFPALPDFLRSSVSGTGSTQPFEYN